MWQSLATVRHILRIARALGRYDALGSLERLDIAPNTVMVAKFLRTFERKKVDPSLSEGQRLVLAIQDMGPTFIKLGQVLATRSDLIGEDVARDLSALQDRLPPFPFATAKAIIEEELGTPLHALYRDFNETPIAAASIAQVHKAVTTDGRDVAVKVIRPEVGEAIARDLALFRWIADIMDNGNEAMRRMRFGEVVKRLEKSVRQEMDLRSEAAAASELAENFAGDPDFYVPAIDWARTARRVMTLEWLNGVRIDNVEAILQAGHDPDALIHKAGNAFFQQVFRDGFFHADLHPGNMFVMPSGQIGVVDFGIMGRLDTNTCHYLADILMGFIKGDYRLVAQAHFRAGYILPDQSFDDFTQACRAIGQPILNKPLNEISLARLLGQLFDMSETFKMPAQPQLLLLQKSMVVAEGIGRTLNPNVNMWGVARPLITQWIAQHRNPLVRAKTNFDTMAEQLARLPRLLDSLENGLQHATIKLDPSSLKVLQQGTKRSPALLTWIMAIAVAVLLSLALTT